MKLNIVTGSSNSLGKKFLSSLANENDLTIGLSRKGCDIAHVKNIQIDLLNDDIQGALINALKETDLNNITSISLIHTAAKIKNEFPDVNNEKYNMIDNDGDGIDDEVLHNTFTTFIRTHEKLANILEQKNLTQIPVFLNIICSLLDKKSRIPTSHASMIKANKLLRKYVFDLCEKNDTYKGVCISVGTIATESEKSYRINADHNYWLSENKVVALALSQHENFDNVYMDTDLFQFNPHYETVYKNETDEQMTLRFKKEIGLM